MKKFLRKIPGFRWLDEFTDTQTGENVVFFLVFLLIVMVILWKAGGK